MLLAVIVKNLSIAVDFILDFPDCLWITPSFCLCVSLQGEAFLFAPFDKMV